MKDKNVLKLQIFLLVMGLFQLLGLESLFQITEYAPYYKSIIFGLIAIWIWTLPRKKSKVKMHYHSDFYIWSFVLSFLLLLSLFLGGVLNGFGNNPYNLSLKGIFYNFMMLVLPMILSIFARHYLIRSARPNKRVFWSIFWTVFIAITQFSYFQYFSNDMGRDWLIFLAGTFAPILAREAILTYFVYMAGPLSALIYLLTTTMPFYILRVLPDLEWLTSAFIYTLLPLFGMFILHETYMGKARLIKLRNQEKESAFSMILFSIASVMIVWFAVGVFPISPKVILTGSMQPSIMPGDMVLVEFIDYEDVEIGDAILFSYGDVDILHRVIDINEDKTLFQTKGDNNLSPDSDWVTPEQIKGVQKGRIPYIGKPLVWLRSK